MTEDTMTQVLLGNGRDRQTAWVPTYAARVGYEVELKEDKKFWVVIRSYNTAVAARHVLGYENNYRSHRNATDI